MIRIVIASLLACAPNTQVPTVWGGEHIELQVSDRGATVDFDCAHGTIDGAIKPDSKGRFEVAGTFTLEHAGPVRDDDAQTRKATYAGTIKEDAMTLRITIAGQEDSGTTYELARGRASNVRKCR